MNGCPVKYSSLAAALLALASLAASLAAGRSLAAPAPQRSTSPVTGVIAEAETSAVLPTFASIPPLPTDVRPFQAWRVAIADARAVGAQTAAEAAAEPWTLADSEGWAARARAEADPPAPMTTPDNDTDAFVREMMRRATPPPRAH